MHIDKKTNLKNNEHVEHGANDETAENDTKNIE